MAAKGRRTKKNREAAEGVLMIPQDFDVVTAIMHHTGNAQNILPESSTEAAFMLADGFGSEPPAEEYWSHIRDSSTEAIAAMAKHLRRAVVLHYGLQDMAKELGIWADLYAAPVEEALEKMEEAKGEPTPGEPKEDANMVPYSTDHPLVGRRVIGIRELSAKEMEESMWYGSPPPVLLLDDGTQLIPQQDEEGNGAGAVYVWHPDRQGLLTVKGIVGGM